MDNARDCVTKEIVEAEDLKLLAVVDTYGYQCTGCETQAFPRSYRPENLLRAHFQIRDPHSPDCETEKESKVIAQGKRGSVQKELETSPGLSPARLQLINTRTIVDPALPRTEQHTQSIGRQDTMGNTARREGRRAANSIRPICRAFLRFPTIGTSRSRSPALLQIRIKRPSRNFVRMGWGSSLKRVCSMESWHGLRP